MSGGPDIFDYVKLFLFFCGVILFLLFENNYYNYYNYSDNNNTCYDADDKTCVAALFVSLVFACVGIGGSGSGGIVCGSGFVVCRNGFVICGSGFFGNLVGNLVRSVIAACCGNCVVNYCAGFVSLFFEVVACEVYDVAFNESCESCLVCCGLGAFAVNCESDIAFLYAFKSEIIVTVCSLNSYYGVLTFGFGRSEKHACGPSYVVCREVGGIGDDGVGIGNDGLVEGNVLDEGCACGNFNDRLNILEVYRFFLAYFAHSAAVVGFSLKACAYFGKSNPFPAGLFVPVAAGVTVNAHGEGYGNVLCGYGSFKLDSGLTLERIGKLCNSAVHFISSFAEACVEVGGGTNDESTVSGKTDHGVAVAEPVKVNGIDNLSSLKLENDGTVNSFLGGLVLDKNDAGFVIVACGSVSLGKDSAVIKLCKVLGSERCNVVAPTFEVYTLCVSGCGEKEKCRNESCCDKYAQKFLHV